jgi:hypothetical protein
VLLNGRAVGDSAAGFWHLLTGFAAQGAAVTIIGVLLVSYLIQLGHQPVCAATVAALPWVGTTTIGAIGCVTVIGLGFGVATIARPAILADRYDTTAYASISGLSRTDERGQGRRTTRSRRCRRQQQRLHQGHDRDRRDPRPRRGHTRDHGPAAGPTNGR